MWTPEQIQNTAARITTANRRRDWEAVKCLERGLPSDVLSAVREAVRAEQAAYMAAQRPTYFR